MARSRYFTTAIGLIAFALSATQVFAQGDSQVQQGLNISPVELNTKGLNVSLVGLGSYIINGPAGCTGCHTNGARFLPGGSPFLGQTQLDNTTNFLGGGRVFMLNSNPAGAPAILVPIVARNLTPDKDGKPAGLTLEEFIFTIRTGTDLKLPAAPPAPWPTPNLLQIMPWYEFRNLTDHDLRGLYEYLRAIPCVEGGPGVPANRC